MADPHDYSNLEEDENNDDTFGSSMIDTGAEWQPDDSGMDDLNTYMEEERKRAPRTTTQPPPGVKTSPFGGFGSAPSTPGQGGSKAKKVFFDDDDIDTLLTLTPSDLLRSSLMDDNDGSEVDMSSVMRSVAIGSRPPGLGVGGPPGLSYGAPSGAYGAYPGFGGPSSLPPGIGARPSPIGSPGGRGGQDQGSAQTSAPAAQANVVPKPPQLTPEQLSQLSPQQLMHMEQWNLLYQQQQLRELQEQHAAQQAQQRAQQAQLLAQHQQMLAQREEAVKRAASVAHAETRSDASSEGGDEGIYDAGNSKANRRGRWAGKGTARMSPYEIDMIIRNMEHQTSSENPFLDDYYNQNVRIMINPNNYTVHRPICDVAPPKRRQLEKDPFAGCLGRISSGSSRAPRIMVVLDEPKDAKTGKTRDVASVLASDKPFSTTLGHLTQNGGIHTTDDRKIMLTIENAFVILLELEDLKQLQHLHLHVAQQPSLRSDAAEVQSTNAKEAQQKDSMIIEHLTQIISLLGIPRIGAPEAHPAHPSYPLWESFMLAVMKIPKGARMIARLLPYLPGAAAISILRVFVRHLTTLSAISTAEDNSSLVNIADYIRRVFLQADLDLLDPMLVGLLDDAANLFAQLPSTLSTKAGFYLLNAILSRVNDLKGKSDITRDSRFLGFLPKFLKFHATLLEHLKGKLPGMLETARSNMAKKNASASGTPFGVTVVAPSNLKEVKPLSRTKISSPYTSEAQMWEFIFYLTLSAMPQEKKNLHAELGGELDLATITATTPMDIVNLKTTFIGVVAQQADPGFENLYKHAQQYAAMQQQQPQQSPLRQGPPGFGPSGPKMAPMHPMAPPPHLSNHPQMHPSMMAPHMQQRSPQPGANIPAGPGAFLGPIPPHAMGLPPGFYNVPPGTAMPNPASQPTSQNAAGNTILQSLGGRPSPGPATAPPPGF